MTTIKFNVKFNYRKKCSITNLYNNNAGKFNNQPENDVKNVRVVGSGGEKSIF